jgi:hypothetical protein
MKIETKSFFHNKVTRTNESDTQKKKKKDLPTNTIQAVIICKAEKTKEKTNLHKQDFVPVTKKDKDLITSSCFVSFFFYFWWFIRSLAISLV